MYSCSYIEYQLVDSASIFYGYYPARTAQQGVKQSVLSVYQKYCQIWKSRHLSNL